LKFFRRSAQTSPSHAMATKREPSAETFASLGLKALLDSLKGDRKYRILDLGPAIGSNIEFLTPYSSKIRVADLYTTLQAGGFFAHGEGRLSEASISGILPIMSEERFDILLSWDLINYFNPEELKVLIRYLTRFCAPGGYFFAMSSTAKEMPALPTVFKILDDQTLLYSAASPEMRLCPRYAPRDLTLLMSDYRINNSYILRNGMQEYVFVHN
jgi:hypothetical protein